MKINFYLSDISYLFAPMYIAAVKRLNAATSHIATSYFYIIYVLGFDAVMFSAESG